jgi:hypothetical protein
VLAQSFGHNGKDDGEPTGISLENPNIKLNLYGKQEPEKKAFKA